MASRPDFLLTLYRAARELPTADFQRLAIRMLQTRLRFASAVWTTGYRGESAAGATLVPILALSQTFETDPAGVDEWRSINRADKTIPIVFAHPMRTQRIHTPALFGSPEDVAMRDYARRFGRQNALITAMSGRESPLAQWCSIYRPDATDEFSRGERAECEALTRHLAEALRINQIILRDPLARAGPTSDAGESAALVDPNGHILGAQPAFLDACGQLWKDFDRRRMPRKVMRELLGPGGGALFARRAALRAASVAGLFLVTITPFAARWHGAPRRLQVAMLFAAGRSSKDIAVILGLSPATIRNHVAAAYGEMGVHSRGELARALGCNAERRASEDETGSR